MMEPYSYHVLKLPYVERGLGNVKKIFSSGESSRVKRPDNLQ